MFDGLGAASREGREPGDDRGAFRPSGWGIERRLLVLELATGLVHAHDDAWDRLTRANAFGTRVAGELV